VNRPRGREETVLDTTNGNWYIVFSFLNNTASFSFQFLCSQLATVIEAKAAKEAAHGPPTELRAPALRNDCVPCRPDLVP